jgi:hypothetical protein
MIDEISSGRSDINPSIVSSRAHLYSVYEDLVGHNRRGVNGIPRAMQALPPISPGLGWLGASRMDALSPSFYNDRVPFAF